MLKFWWLQRIDIKSYIRNLYMSNGLAHYYTLGEYTVIPKAIENAYRIQVRQQNLKHINCTKFQNEI